MGSAAIAGPDSVKKAAELSLKDITLDGVVTDGMHNIITARPIEEAGSDTTWAVKQLAKIRSMTKKDRERKKRSTYVGSLDVNVATLRSVSITHKYRMSKEITFKRNQENEETYLEGIIKGWWR